MQQSRSVDGPTGRGRGQQHASSERPRLDLKKVFLIAGLAALSWISTYSGMLELIEANLGQIDIVFKLAVGGSVAMLMLMVVWLLDQLFNERPGIAVRVLYVAGYLFLTLISVGFSFGFYWKFLESRTEATRGAETAVTGVQAALLGAQTRLGQMQTTFDQLAAVSTQKAEAEVTLGNSCPNSRPGDGPRRRLREADAASFTAASQFVQGRAKSIKNDIDALGADLQKIVKQDKSTFDPATGTRNEFIKALGRKIDLTVTGYNAFKTDPQLRQLRADFAERADKTIFPDEQGKTFSCPDTQLQTVLKGAIKSIDALPLLEKPEINTVEGADATIEAFRRLTVTLTSLLQMKLPPSPEEIRALQQRAVQTQSNDPSKGGRELEAGLGQRDYIPLAIAVFVDLCLLLVSIPKTVSAAERTRRRRERLDGGTFRTLDDLYAIHDDPDTRKRLEPFRHIAFESWGRDYVAVPMIAGQGALTRPAAERSSLRLGGLMRSFRGYDAEPEVEAVEEETISEADLKEAQFLLHFFASHEKDGPYELIWAARTFDVNKKLAALGSKWARIKAFRIYRFASGAWSDFILDVIVGADREMEPLRASQKSSRLAEYQLKAQDVQQKVEERKLEHDLSMEDKRQQASLTQRRRELEHQTALLRVEREAAEEIDIERTRKAAVDAEFQSLRPGEKPEPTLPEGATAPSSGMSGLIDNIFGRRSRPRAVPAQPAAAQTVAAQPAVTAGPAAEVAQAAPAGAPATPSPDIAALRDTVSQLAMVMAEMARQQSAAIGGASRPTAAAGTRPGPAVAPSAAAPAAAATAPAPADVKADGQVNGHAHPAARDIRIETAARQPAPEARPVVQPRLVPVPPAAAQAASQPVNGHDRGTDSLAALRLERRDGPQPRREPTFDPPAPLPAAEPGPAAPDAHHGGAFAEPSLVIPLPRVASAPQRPSQPTLRRPASADNDREPLPASAGNTALDLHAELRATAPSSEAPGQTGLLGQPGKVITDLFKRFREAAFPAGTGALQSLDHDPIEPLVSQAVRVDASDSPLPPGAPWHEPAAPAWPPAEAAPGQEGLSSTQELESFLAQCQTQPAQEPAADWSSEPDWQAQPAASLPAPAELDFVIGAHGAAELVETGAPAEGEAEGGQPQGLDWSETASYGADAEPGHEAEAWGQVPQAWDAEQADTLAGSEQRTELFEQSLPAELDDAPAWPEPDIDIQSIATKFGSRPKRKPRTTN